MYLIVICLVNRLVAPARERGLKSSDVRKVSALTGRSREGAWIEMNPLAMLLNIL